jgi:ATP:ADP antiporter, AAA family
VVLPIQLVPSYSARASSDMLLSASIDRPVRRVRDSGPLVALVVLYFLVVCAIGILRPIKNALALDGLGATDFYKVYVVSALVVLFVPIFNRLADRFPWRWLVPGTAAFFAINLVAFRAFYVPGSGTYGLLFYGWYDLFAAALVTQFFIATQLYLNTRNAKRAYPLIIAGGSIGATVGGAITGWFAGMIGTPNLLLVAAAIIIGFCFAIPFAIPAASAAPRTPRQPTIAVSGGEIRTVFANRQVQLIAISVLMTILVKQLIDYQFNVATKEVFVDRDAISGFQGKFNAATQWLPIVVLAALRPGLRRWGVGVAVLLLPVFMLAANVALATMWGLWMAAGAKGSEGALRYSAERTSREILYVPVPEEIKLKAKAYIDVALEKGVAKALSALMIFLLLQVVEVRQVPYVAAVICVGWMGVAFAVRREYVRTLARSIEGRFASLRGGFASLLDANTLAPVRRALVSDSPLQVAFALELIDQAAPAEARRLAPELVALVDHPSEEIRERALNLLARYPVPAETAPIRARLTDESMAVREAAVAALVAVAGNDRNDVIRDLVASNDSRISLAILGWLTRDGGAVGSFRIDEAFLMERQRRLNGGPTDRRELALAAGLVSEPRVAGEFLDPLLRDTDLDVRVAAIRASARARYEGADDALLMALGTGATREAARAALAARGPRVLPLLVGALHDPACQPAIRRNVPSVLAAIPHERVVEALIRAIRAPETDQLLDYRALKALSKLRSRYADLAFPEVDVLAMAQRDVVVGCEYLAALKHLGATKEFERFATGVAVSAPAPPWPADASAGAASLAALEVESGDPPPTGAPVEQLLRTALEEGVVERRECVFRALGLIYDPQAIHSAYLAVTRGSASARANAF